MYICTFNALVFTFKVRMVVHTCSIVIFEKCILIAQKVACGFTLYLDNDPNKKTVSASDMFNYLKVKDYLIDV